MTRSFLVLAIALAGLAGFPDRMPPQLVAPPGYLLRDEGLRELAPADLAARPGVFPFPVGEKLVYQVRYFGIDVGTAEIEVARAVAIGERRYAHLVATARTNDVFSAFYRVDDRSEALVDLDSGRVERSRTRLLHGGKEAREEIRYDWDTHFVHVRKVKVEKRSVRDVVFDFGPFVHDVFDAFYALRRVPYETGAEAELPVCASRKIHGFRVRPAGMHPVAVAAFGPAPVDAFELRPTDTIDGVAHAAGDGRVYVKNDAQRIPVLLDGWFRFSDYIRIGGVGAELVRYEPGRADWPAAQPPPWTAPPLAPRSVEGRPRWDPPAGVVAARKRSGVVAAERSETLAPPEAAGQRAPGAAGKPAPPGAAAVGSGP